MMVPMAGMVSITPSPSGPAWNTSRANTGIRAKYDRPSRLMAATVSSSVRTVAPRQA